jgi:hypothetical protein
MDFIKTNEWQLSLFERKVLQCIFGAKQENKMWQKRYNYELYETFNDSNTVNYIKIKRLAWAGHFQRCPVNYIYKNLSYDLL